MYKKIVIISSGQPSANPRAVKEAILLSQNSFDVTFIYCPLSPWADAFDENLFAENDSIKWIRVGFHPIKNKLGYWYARARKKSWFIINKFFQNKFESSVKSTVLFSQELLQEGLKHKADLYIGHNLGAIAAVYMSAKKYNAKTGFDAEDFHRGEFTDNDVQRQISISIENNFFPKMDYCTVASPLIGEAYREIFPAQLFTVINNVFSIKYLKEENTTKQKKTMDLFWFSQFIGSKRGLETVLLALNQCNELDIKLHLLGNVSESYKRNILSILNNKSKISFLPPAASEDIFQIARNYDVGIASEPAFSENNNMALSNKIYTYLLSGNALLLSSTKAQSAFFEEYPKVGILYKLNDDQDLAHGFKKLYNDRLLLEKMKENSLQLANILNWENEGKIFLTIVKTALNSN